MTALELLRERLLKDKEIFPHYNEYINGILSDIDNELLAMEKSQIIDAYLKDRRGKFDEVLRLIYDAQKYYNETYEETYESKTNL